LHVCPLVTFGATTFFQSFPSIISRIMLCFMRFDAAAVIDSLLNCGAFLLRAPSSMRRRSPHVIILILFAESQNGTPWVLEWNSRV
jgi:hypothetical protein